VNLQNARCKNKNNQNDTLNYTTTVSFHASFNALFTTTQLFDAMWPKLKKTTLNELKIICDINLINLDILSQFLPLTNFGFVSLNHINSHRRKIFHHNLKMCKTN
jgi:hypothetical protein